LSVEQVTAVYRNLRYFRWDHDYPRDHHFRPCFELIRTRADVESFLVELQMDRLKVTDGVCPKVRSIRDALDHPACKWDKLEEHILHTLTRARRICCWCHETGSYALYERT